MQSARDKVARLEARIEELSVADDVDELALDATYEELEEMDPNTFEAKAGSILHGLGFSQEMMRKATKDMSGGWRMRVALARALFVKPDAVVAAAFSEDATPGLRCDRFAGSAFTTLPKVSFRMQTAALR